MSAALSASSQPGGLSSGAPLGHQVQPPPHTSMGPAPTHFGFTGTCGQVSGCLSPFNVSVSDLRLSLPSVQPGKQCSR